MKKIQLPTSWNEVTIKMQADAEADHNEFPDDFKSLAIVAAYASISLDELKKLPFNVLTASLENLAFTQNPISNKPGTEFIFKDETYYVTPTLIKNELQDFWTLHQLSSLPNPHQQL